MGKQAYGVPNKHVMKSKGGDTDVMKFYCTSYGTNYGKKHANFQPRQGKHTGTGYLSNFRPGVYYSPHLDEIDNPSMGTLVGNNYHSVTEKSFQPYKGPVGDEPLPNSSKQCSSGFTREQPLTVPTQNDGPGYLTTETQEKFKGGQPDRSLAELPAGAKEETGFTHGHSVEPITFHPDYAHHSDIPPWFTDRPTGVSIMKTHFRPSEFAKGSEPLPRLANRSERDTGFTSSTKARPAFLHRVPSDAYDKAGDMPPGKLDRMRKADPTEYMNMVNPNNYSSVSANTYRGAQNPAGQDRLARSKSGQKEPSGFSANNDNYRDLPDHPDRFVTHYQTRYLDRTPKGLDREGHTWGGVQPQRQDGFTRSTRVHGNGAELDSTTTLRTLEPYVARSMKARDAFFDDHTYDNRMHATSFQKSMTTPVA